MALLTDNNFYEVAFRQTNDAAWAGGPFSPTIPSQVTANIVAAVSFMIYVTDSANGAFAYSGGSCDGGFDDALIVGSPVGPLSKIDLYDDAFNATSMAVGSDGRLYEYIPARGFITSYSPSDAAALKAFLP